MKFARKLFEIARRPSSHPKAVDKYFNKIIKETKRQAEDGQYTYKFVFKSRVAAIREELGNRLYAEGFEVETRSFPFLGDFDVIVRWDKENPKEPVHRTFT